MPAAPIYTARRDGIFFEDIHEEVLIYDTHTDTGHALSETAAVVWRTCEGGATLDEIAGQLVARGIGDTKEAGAVLADRAVAELTEKHLLDASGVQASAAVTRRHALRRIAGVGGSAIVAPLVVSAAIPTLAQAHGSPVSGCVQTGGLCSPNNTINAGNNCCTSTGDTCISSHCTACLPATVSCNKGYQCCSGVCSGGTCTA